MTKLHHCPVSVAILRKLFLCCLKVRFSHYPDALGHVISAVTVRKPYLSRTADSRVDRVTKSSEVFFSHIRKLRLYLKQYATNLYRATLSGLFESSNRLRSVVTT